MTLISINGCSLFGNTKPQIPIAWNEHKDAISALTTWSARGKFSILHEKKTTSGNIYWQQKGDVFNIQLSGPAGFGRLILKGSPQQLTVKSKSGIQSFNSPEQALAFYQLPPLPVNDIRYWIKGMPSPTEKTIKLTLSKKLIKRFAQNNHIIQIDSYNLSHDYALPRKMTLTHSHYHTTLFLKQWNTK